METKEQKIVRGIRLAWSSLDSHLDWTHSRLPEVDKKRGENHAFHKKCVQEYADIIKIFSELW